jgi:hypothetical protein
MFEIFLILAMVCQFSCLFQREYRRSTKEPHGSSYTEAWNKTPQEKATQVLFILLFGKILESFIETIPYFE